MAQVHETVVIDAPADEVWKLAGDPARIHEWVPILADAQAENGERSCTTQDGQQVGERVLEHSDEERFYTYEIVESPFPLRSYVSGISVGGHDGHAHVDWYADFEGETPEAETELVAAFTQLYRDGLDTLRARFEGVRA